MPSVREDRVQAFQVHLVATRISWPALNQIVCALCWFAHERPFKQRLEVGLAGDLTADVANDPPEPNAQEAQLAVMPVELLGVGVAPAIIAACYCLHFQKRHMNK